MLLFGWTLLFSILDTDADADDKNSDVDVA
jgi:hypothetical protein